MLIITPQITLQDWEITESFTRAQGAGGQHVNKTSTAVELRFEAARSPNLSPDVKKRLQKIAGQKWTNEGAIIIRAEETRSQPRNRAIALERLKALIIKAAFRPKARIATKPSYASKQRRLTAKTQRGMVKTLRGKLRDEE